MATLYNNAAGGVLGAAVTTANSGGGSGMAWDYVDAGGSFLYDSVASHGTIGYEIDCTANRVSFGWTSGSIVASMDQSYRAYIRLDTLPTAEIQIVTPWNTTQYIAAINLGIDGKIKVAQRGGSVLFTSAAGLTLDTWYRVEISVEVGTSSSDGVLRFAYFLGDGTTPVETQFTSTTADLGTANCVAWYMGKLGNSGDWIGYFDSIELNTSSSALMGPYVSAKASLRPQAVLSNTGLWANVGGASGISAGQADELDTTYAQTPASPSNAEITFELDGRLATGTPNVTVRLSASTATPETYCDVELLQGTTVIATRNFGPLTTTATDYSYTLTGVEAGNITDRSDLRVRVIGDQP